MSAFADINFTVPVNACETVSGQYVDVVSPDPNTIVFTDIAWALSRQARFAGHTLSEEVWTVAQHSVFVKYLVELVLDPSSRGSPLLLSLVKWLKDGGHSSEDVKAGLNDFRLVDIATCALMHDASEAYLIDLPSPVKRHAALREPYKALEHGINMAIATALNLPAMSTFDREIITWADLLALRI